MYNNVSFLNHLLSKNVVKITRRLNAKNNFDEISFKNYFFDFLDYPLWVGHFINIKYIYISLLSALKLKIKLYKLRKIINNLY